MIASLDQQATTPANYLDWEAKQEIRHEYVEGVVYAMTGSTIPYNAIAINLIAMLRNQLRGSPCRVLGGDAKVRIAESPLRGVPLLTSSYLPVLLRLQQFHNLERSNVS